MATHIDDLINALSRVRDGYEPNDSDINPNEDIDDVHDNKDVDDEVGADGVEEQEDDFATTSRLMSLAKRINATPTLTHKDGRPATRVLDAQDEAYFLDKDLAKLRETNASLSQAEADGELGAKRMELKQQAAEVGERRKKLSARVGKM